MTLFEKYPYINNLRSLVPDELIETEIGSKAADFEKDIKKRVNTSAQLISMQYFLRNWKKEKSFWRIF